MRDNEREALARLEDLLVGARYNEDREVMELSATAYRNANGALMEIRALLTARLEAVADVVREMRNYEFDPEATHYFDVEQLDRWANRLTGPTETGG